MKQDTEQLEQTPGMKEIVFAVRPDMPFEEIVEQLRVVLTIPELPGVRGCSPCFSGLDRFLLENVILEKVR